MVKTEIEPHEEEDRTGAIKRKGRDEGPSVVVDRILQAISRWVAFADGDEDIAASLIASCLRQPFPVTEPTGVLIGSRISYAQVNKDWMPCGGVGGGMYI
jgi:hypothetical protein